MIETFGNCTDDHLIQVDEASLSFKSPAAHVMPQEVSTVHMRIHGDLKIAKGCCHVGGDGG